MEDEERWNEKLEAKEEKRDKGMIGECCCIAALLCRGRRDR